MTNREQLLQELEQTPDYLIEEILDFCLFLRQRHPIQEPTQPASSQILEAIAALPIEGKTDHFSGQNHAQVLYGESVHEAS
ncbi:MAG: hypothetical protein VKJ64_03020 [Leptolyngbyaceae bacterium]|nr:hypothetical protein [Leptolyngbyaceae bacterium]